MEREREREREKQDGRGKAEDGVCKRRHGPMCVRLLFKMEEALLFLTENHMKRENEEWACCKITKQFSKLCNETQRDNIVLKKKAKNQKYKTQTFETIY